MKLIRVFFVLFALCIPLLAFGADDPNADEMELRAREIGRSLRCVVCQNQSIEDSDAVLAEDMRTLVRKRLDAGDTNQQVIEFMHNRYGDFVLLKPPVQKNTYILWFLPFALLALLLIWYVARSRRGGITEKLELKPLNDDEKQRLDQLMEKGE